MAIPVAQGEKVWKEINDLLNADKYKEAAELFVKSGGNARGAKRTWNVAQANNKIAGGKVPGPIYGLIDKKHSYDKFLAAMPGDSAAPAKNKVASKEPESAEDLSLGYKTLGDKRRVQSLQVKDGVAAGADLAKRMGKKAGGDADLAKTLGKDADRLQGMAVKIKRVEELEKKDASGARMKREERAELAELKKATLKYRTKKGVAQGAMKEFHDANTKEEIKAVLEKNIEEKIRLDSRETVVDLLGKIRNVAQGEEAVNLHLLLKRVFRNKNNQKSIDELVAKYQEEIKVGIAHIDAVDKVLNKYEQGTDISRKELDTLNKEIVKMLPTMKADQKTDLKGFSAYNIAARKLKEFLGKNKEPDADDLEEILDGMSTYQNSLKRKKKSIKEDILFNIN